MVVNDEKNQDEDDDGDGGADVDCGEKHSQFYIYKLPIDRLSGCYWLAILRLLALLVLSLTGSSR